MSRDILIELDEDEEELLTRYPDAIDQLEVLKNDYLGGNV